MQTGERYKKLLEIAKEGTSEKRRELLHEVTDFFFDSGEKSEIESSMFGELMAKVAFELDTEVRRELAIRFEGGNAPRPLAVRLANEEIDIAAPILRNTTSLTDEDLIGIVSTKGTAYQMAVSKRAIVSEIVSDALVNHGDDSVVKSLLENQGARIGDDTYDKVLVRAENNEELQSPLANRAAIPPDVLQQLYTIVSGPMKNEILQKFNNYSEEEIKAAMEKAQNRVAIINRALPDDFEQKKNLVLKMKMAGTIKPQALPNIWREGDKTLFYLVFAELCKIDYHAAARPFEQKDVDGIAILCRANSFDRPLFVTLAVFVLGQSGMGEAETLGRMYNDVPIDAAQRALRFMQVRSNSMKEAA